MRKRNEAVDHKVKNEESDEELSFACSFAGCTKTFPNNHGKLTHEGMKHGPTDPNPEEETSYSSRYDDCNKSYPTNQGKIVHEHMVHNTTPKVEPTIPCSFDGCDKKFTTDHGRITHMHVAHTTVESKSTEASSTSFKCDICPKSFKVVGRMKSHMSQAHEHMKDPSVAIFVCAYCPKKYERYTSLYRHHNQRHEDKLRPFMEQFKNAEVHTISLKCQKCPKTFRTSKKLQSHVNAIHGGPLSAEHACSFCPKKYDRHKSLMTHHDRNHKDKPKPYMRQFKDREDSSSYESSSDEYQNTGPTSSDDSVHEDEDDSRSKKASTELIRCQFCPKMFGASRTLHYHISTRHKDLKDTASEIFNCAHCPKKYNLFVTLYNHYKRKHQDKPRPMRIDFNKTGRLNVTTVANNNPQDMNVTSASTVSVSSEQFTCDQCSKDFMNADFLKKHKLTHAPPPPPAKVFCADCGQVFKEAQQLDLHKNSSECNQSTSKDSTVNEREKEAWNPDTPVELHRKRRRDESSENIENLRHDDNLFSPPVHKRAFNKNENRQRVLSSTPTASESSSARVKIETESSSIVDVEPVSPQRDIKMEPSEIIAVQKSPFVERRSPRSSTATIWKYLNSQPESQTKNETNALPSTPALTVVNNDSDDCMIVEPDTPVTSRKAPLPFTASPSTASELTSISRRQSINSQTESSSSTLSTTVSIKNIEKNPLPLSAAIFARAVQYPSEMMIIWTNSLEEDLLSAAKLNPMNCLLCIQELDMFSLSEKQREKLKKSQRVTFTMLTSDDNTSAWTVITFAEQSCSIKLNNKLFRNFQDVEKVISDHAESNGKTVNNMMRCDDGLFPILSQKLIKKTMGFNYEEKEYIN